jgi:acetate kinase
VTDQPVLVINSGSSSVKYQLVRPSGLRMAIGLVERIGEADSTWRHTAGSDSSAGEGSIADHDAAFGLIGQLFQANGPDLNAADVQAVGHRVVHGGARFVKPTLLTVDVLDEIEALSTLAPLHNPPAVAGIRAAQRMLPDVPHVAVFDTAFFATLPEVARTYAIPRDLAERHAIRRYGFHGTSHAYVSRLTADVLERPYGSLNQIVLHLGNGCSASAIRGGVAVETSMGLTPLEGLVMGTRSGDVDPGLHAFLADALQISTAEVNTLLNKESGLLGLAGVNDFREIEKRRRAGDHAATLAFEVYVHRIRSYVGAYLVQLGSLDALVFTAGVGENSPVLRAAVTKGLGAFGIVMDEKANELASKAPRMILVSCPSSVMSATPRRSRMAAASRIRSSSASGRTMRRRSLRARSISW